MDLQRSNVILSIQFNYANLPFNYTSLLIDLRNSESEEEYPYNDYTGKRIRLEQGNVSIGIGRNLDANPLSNREMEVLLASDLERTLRYMDQTWPMWTEHPEPVVRSLFELMFSMGPGSFNPQKWPNFNRHLVAHRYDSAAMHLKASKWYRDVKSTRGNRVVDQIKSAHDKLTLTD